jgi:fibronectin type 3 domain-containing protein
MRPLFDSEILEPSIEVSFERSSDLIPPDRFRITSTADRQISLSWDPVLVGDVAGYVVTRGNKAAGRYELVGQTRSRFESLYRDAGVRPEGLGDGRTYHYRVHPYDAEGRVSRSHAYLVATTDPAPEVPENLRAYSNLPRRVVLEWEPSPNPSVAAYAVHRSPTVAGPWERVAVVEGRLQTVHEDPVLGDLRVMYYRIRALNAFGGASNMTAPIRAVTKAEPLPPMDLELEERSLGRVHLRWAPNIEDDIITYEVWREERGDRDWGEAHLIAQVGAAPSKLVDATVACSELVRYRLRDQRFLQAARGHRRGHRSGGQARRRRNPMAPLGCRADAELACKRGSRATLDPPRSVAWRSRWCGRRGDLRPRSRKAQHGRCPEPRR